MPVPALMAATDVLLLLQIPPDTPVEVSGVVLPVHIASVPMILPALGSGGSMSVFILASVPVQPLLVIEKLLYEPEDKPLNVKALEVIEIDFGLPAPV